jgi:hypothetical protein
VFTPKPIQVVIKGDLGDLATTIPNQLSSIGFELRELRKTGICGDHAVEQLGSKHPCVIEVKNLWEDLGRFMPLPK